MNLHETLKNNAHVATSPRGVNSFGLYIEFVEVKPGSPDEKQREMRWYNRIFVAGCAVFRYRRDAGTARTVWRLDKKLPTPKQAMDHVTKLMAGGSALEVVMRGAPILVQLEPTDVQSVEANLVPSARYRGNNRHETIYGKLADGGVAKPASLDVRGLAAVIRELTAGAAETKEPY